MKKHWLLITVIVLAALVLRMYAAATLPIDYDEPVYYTAARFYANLFQNGRTEFIPVVDYNYEHPALAKLAYGGVLSFFPSDGPFWGDVWQFFGNNEPLLSAVHPEKVFALRMVSVFFGTLETAALAIVSPLAGLLLAIDSISIKYTSVIYLEALPGSLSILGALLFSSTLGWLQQKEKLSIKNHKKETVRLALAALCLGAAAAAKYPYGIVALAVGLVYLLTAIRARWNDLARWGLILAFAVLTLAAFIAANPYLYPDPAGRLVHSLQYSMDYQNGEAVAAAGYPFYQPLIWLSHPVTDFLVRESQPMPMRGGEFLFHLDTVIFILALAGLPRLFKRRPVFFAWLAIGLVFLLVWNTKWPQYAVLVVGPLCLSATEGLKTLAILAMKLLARIRQPAVAKIEWLVNGTSK